MTTTSIQVVGGVVAAVEGVVVVVGEERGVRGG